MTALPIPANENAVREAVRRLSHIQPGDYQVVSCYLKLEPRDKTRGKYLIKMKNRVKQVAAELGRRPLDHGQRKAVAADLDRVIRYFEEPSRLPAARGIAVFACGPLDLFEVLPLPHVHRSRLAVAPVPLVRELVALEEEFGTILVAACDRTSARFFEVTAYDVGELPSLTAEATRPGKFHGERQAKRGNMLAGGFGEHNYHMRIREERQRHYAQVADRIFQIHTQRALAGPVREGVGSGWAVNGIAPTLKALERGQVRTLLADGADDDPQIDDAVEEALAQRVQVDVVYDERARGVAGRRHGSHLHRAAPDSRNDRAGGDPGRRRRGGPVDPLRRPLDAVPPGQAAAGRRRTRRRACDWRRFHSSGGHDGPAATGDRQAVRSRNPDLRAGEVHRGVGRRACLGVTAVSLEPS